MSKSTGNVIPINTTAEDMYGKIMSIPDEAMIKYFRLATRLLPEEIDKIEYDIKSNNIHPRDVKMKLALEISSIFYGNPEAIKGEAAFIQLFQKGSLPDDMPEFLIQSGETVLDIMVRTNLVYSRNEGRRLIQQNGVRLDGDVVNNGQDEVSKLGVLQVGKRKFVRLIK
jgi:tyrosyl-tRNA synthetase